MKQNIERKTWDEFRNTGLLLFVNQFLHLFGWVIVVEIDDATGTVANSYPARTKYRGFDNKNVEEAHSRLAKYLKDNASEMNDDVNEQ